MAEEKSPADGLPPGWTVEVRVRKNGKKDRCYTDPSNGLKFFSKPEVFRYLNNMEVNRPKSKRKRNGGDQQSIINSPAMAKGENIAESRKSRSITKSQSSKLVGVVKDEKVLKSSTGGCVPPSEDPSDQGMEKTSSGSFNLPEATDTKQIEEKSDPVTTAVVSAPVICPLEEKPPEDEVESPGNRKMQVQGQNGSGNKKKPDLPRRTSKRLAGIDIGPIPELKTNNRPRKAPARQLDRTEAQDNTDEKQGSSNVLPPDNPSFPEEQTAMVETDDKTEEEPASLVNFSLNDLWKDPCIEFAIKTLTGAIPVGDDNKAEEQSSLELPLGDSWGDPCIEFAVKTLTGAIPVADDWGIQDYLQQQLTSSESKGEKSSSLPNTGEIDQQSQRKSIHQ
ncbi:hypothetical protein NMG60_11018132 [Bertholletia excelsa]